MSNEMSSGTFYVRSRDRKSLALVSGSIAELESPMAGKTDTIQLYSSIALQAAFSNNRRLFAAVLGGGIVNQLYVWHFDEESGTWSSGKQAASALGTPASLEWSEADSPHPYPPLELVLTTSDGKILTFPLERLLTDDASHRRSRQTR